MTKINSSCSHEGLAEFVAASNTKKPSDLTVACYTFPHFHRSALNDKLYGKGWTEYVLARGALPWYPGHHQPRTPLLGELDERDPATWERYNEIASEHGLDVFIWDSYWFDDRPVLHEALEEGFLGSCNNNKMKFAVMWTNHNWPIFFPTVNSDGTNNLLLTYQAPESKENIWRSMSYLICRYFHQPNYLRIGDCPVLVIWNLPLLLRHYGNEGTCDLLNELRDYAKKLGHKGIHFHVTGQSRSIFEQLESIGIDSYGRYNCLPEASVRIEVSEGDLPQYDECVYETVKNIWPENNAESSLPFFPAVNPGWDTSPRRCVPPNPAPTIDDGDTVWPAVIANESPGLFQDFIKSALALLNENSTKPSIMTIGCWNEWTEGQYMLPDTLYGYGMLRALSEALGIDVSKVDISSGQLIG